MRVEIGSNRRRFLGHAAKCFVGVHLGMTGCAKAQLTGALNLPVEGDLPSFAGATTWLNSQPLTARGLRGSVVLVNFWTFSRFVHDECPEFIHDGSRFRKPAMNLFPRNPDETVRFRSEFPRTCDALSRTRARKSLDLTEAKEMSSVSAISPRDPSCTIRVLSGVRRLD